MSDGIARSGLPRIRPLALCLALALGAAQPALRAEDPPLPELRQHELTARPGPDRRGLLSTYPPGHPYHSQLLAVLDTPVAEDRPRATITVTNCNNGGLGSLRQAVLDAASGDVIDMSGLTCSEITLTTGALITAVDELTLKGPGGLFSIDGNGSSQVFIHLGTGSVQFRDLILSGGRKYVTGSGDASGGCVHSTGDVALIRSTVKYCEAEAAGSGMARGGGVHADGTVLLQDSVVRDNDVINGSGGGIFSNTAVVSKYSTVRDNRSVEGDSVSGSGGGVRVNGDFTSKYSTFRDNNGDGFGGGVAVTNGDVVIRHSTISGNMGGATGGLDLFGNPAINSALIVNSTIANNEGGYAGGLYVSIPLEMHSSTVSGNVERHDESPKYGAGLRVVNGAAVYLRNTLISGNSKFAISGDGLFRSDLVASGSSPLVVAGSGNLILHRSNVTLPADTIEADARLGPLADHGGRTQTMRPLRNSRAINRGVPAGTLTVDQRGTGFPRTVGVGVDIGAFETDTLFGFDFERD